MIYYCIKCGHKNTVDSKFCEKCNAVLIRMHEEGESSSLIHVEDGFTYLYPEHVYVTERVQNLLEAVYNYLHNIGDVKRIREAFEEVKKYFDEFEKGPLHEILETLDDYKEEDLWREYSRQMNYLLNKGAQLCREGIRQIEEFFVSNVNDHVIEGILRIQEATDNFGVANDLIQANLQVLEEEKTRRLLASRADEFESRIKDAEKKEEAEEQVKKAEDKPEEKKKEEYVPVLTIEEDVVEVEDIEKG